MISGSSPARSNAFKQSTVALTALCGAWLLFSTACASRPNDETVTTLPRSAKSPTTNARFVSYGSPPPQPVVTSDRDLEAAGDCIARSLVRFREPNRHAALEALDNAHRIILTRLRADVPAGTDGDRLRLQLEEVAREIAEARTQIERGDINRARQQLTLIGAELDRLAR
ncbi:MAG: hypothetical protein H0W76_11850 [Pyrinomonadaceae bacterium]|nr:hypothetical protein [Pyrinomonadaceae bacterium]